MSIVVVTGSAGLIGSEVVKFYAGKGRRVVGIDNDMRRQFFGEEASTAWNAVSLQDRYPDDYEHHSIDIRDQQPMEAIFRTYADDIDLIIHTAAQPSHDWAATDPLTDFTVNANSTLILLELTRKYAPDATFIFTSTNKVYGDTPNFLPLSEQETRWEIAADHPYHDGIDETMTIDQSKHSLFGVSKAAADLMVQEYGRYFEMKTVAFRGGCLTGPAHSGTRLHGFLAYLMRCAIEKKEYTIYGYKGKQVRDNIHSHDLVMAFDCFYRHPKIGEVYNVGGSRHSNCSIIEAIRLCEEITGNTMITRYADDNRIGDHIWWISGVKKFQSDYPEWEYKFGMKAILLEIYNRLCVAPVATAI